MIRSMQYCENVAQRTHNNSNLIDCAGNTTVSHNEIVEGPRDAFGVYGQRFGCFGPDGAGSLTCGKDCNHPGVVKKLYGEPCDFWCGLRSLTTQWIEISYNKVANVVRDTSDAGALE